MPQGRGRVTPGSPVESAVARLHRDPAIPASLPAEWADLIRAMTALDPMDRPGATDLETALRQALISPQSLPGLLAEERTRVLPAPPARPPRLLPPDGETLPSRLDSDAAAKAGDTAKAHPTAKPNGLAQLKSTEKAKGTAKAKRTPAPKHRIVLLSAALAGLALATAALLAVTAPEAPAVVPYPTVTGTLGEHLEQLHKSVQP